MVMICLYFLVLKSFCLYLLIVSDGVDDNDDEDDGGVNGDGHGQEWSTMRVNDDCSCR